MLTISNKLILSANMEQFETYWEERTVGSEKDLDESIKTNNFLTIVR